LSHTVRLCRSWVSPRSSGENGSDRAAQHFGAGSRARGARTRLCQGARGAVRGGLRGPELALVPERPPDSRALQSARRLNRTTYLLAVRRHKRAPSEPFRPHPGAAAEEQCVARKAWLALYRQRLLVRDGRRASLPLALRATAPRAPSSKSSCQPLGRRSGHWPSLSECANAQGEPDAALDSGDLDG
jgi:hypothetical protein